MDRSVDKVHSKFSWGESYRHNPWGALLGAAGVGVLIGHAVGSHSHQSPTSIREDQPPGILSKGRGLLSITSARAAGLLTGGLASALTQIFDEEIKSAMGATLGALWTQARPLLPTAVSETVDLLMERTEPKLSRQAPTGPAVRNTP